MIPTPPPDITTLADFHYDGREGFNGHDCLGYIGNGQRNYVTDEWVNTCAATLGWGYLELDVWATSVWGRWALDVGPLDRVDMLREMTRAPIRELVDGALDVCRLTEGEEG